MGETNPRYPHWCRIIRKTTDDPLEDEEDFTPVDGTNAVGGIVSNNDDYDPMGSEESEPVNDHEQQEEMPAENSSSSEEPDEGTQTTVIYEGKCRSYKINTTSDKGEVITSQRGLALPLNQDGWDKLGVVPMEGDEIIVVHGDSFKEYGRIVDKNVATARFAGTHLVWRYVRN